MTRASRRIVPGLVAGFHDVVRGRIDDPELEIIDASIQEAGVALQRFDIAAQVVDDPAELKEPSLQFGGRRLFRFLGASRRAGQQRRCQHHPSHLVPPGALRRMVNLRNGTGTDQHFSISTQARRHHNAPSCINAAPSSPRGGGAGNDLPASSPRSYAPGQSTCLGRGRPFGESQASVPPGTVVTAGKTAFDRGVLLTASRASALVFFDTAAAAAGAFSPVGVDRPRCSDRTTRVMPSVSSLISLGPGFGPGAFLPRPTPTDEQANG